MTSVASLHRYPVTSLPGEEPAGATLGPAGLRGDCHAIVDASARPSSVLDVPVPTGR